MLHAKFRDHIKSLNFGQDLYHKRAWPPPSHGSFPNYCLFLPSCNLNPLHKLTFPLSCEAPHEIWLQSGMENS